MSAHLPGAAGPGDAGPGDLAADLEAAGLRPDEPGLGDLLAALTAPPSTGELAGEQAALAMFRANLGVPAAAPHQALPQQALPRAGPTSATPTPADAAARAEAAQVRWLADQDRIRRGRGPDRGRHGQCRLCGSAAAASPALRLPGTRVCRRARLPARRIRAVRSQAPRRASVCPGHRARHRTRRPADDSARRLFGAVKPAAQPVRPRPGVGLAPVDRRQPAPDRGRRHGRPGRRRHPGRPSRVRGHGPAAGAVRRAGQLAVGGNGQNNGGWPGGRPGQRPTGQRGLPVHRGKRRDKRDRHRHGSAGRHLAAVVPAWRPSPHGAAREVAARGPRRRGGASAPVRQLLGQSQEQAAGPPRAADLPDLNSGGRWQDVPGHAAGDKHPRRIGERHPDGAVAARRSARGTSVRGCCPNANQNVAFAAHTTAFATC